MAYTQDIHSANHGAPGAADAKIDPDLAHAISVGYEPHDVGLRGIVIFLISLVIITLLVLATVWVLLKGFVSFDRSYDPIGSPVVIDQAAAPHPLQPSWSHNQTDAVDMEQMREQTDHQLHSTGTSPTGRKYIPIETAMDEILPQLPIRAAQQPGSGGGDR